MPPLALRDQNRVYVHIPEVRVADRRGSAPARAAESMLGLSMTRLCRRDVHPSNGEEFITLAKSDFGLKHGHSSGLPSDSAPPTVHKPETAETLPMETEILSSNGISPAAHIQELQGKRIPPNAPAFDMLQTLLS